jgi:hypothetical protein
MKSTKEKSVLGYIFANTTVTIVWSLLFLGISWLIRDRNVLSLFAVPPEAESQPSEAVLFASDMLKELGFALIIGVMIVEGIERISKKEQLDEVNKLIDLIKENVIEAVYGTEIANVFFSPFKERIISSPLLRKKSYLEINLTCGEANLHSDSLVTLDITEDAWPQCQQSN